MTGRKPAAALLSLLLLAPACVSKSKYKGVVADLEDSKAKEARTEKARANAEDENQRLQGKLAQAKEEAEKLRGTYGAELQAAEEELEALRQQREEHKKLIAEFRDLTAKFQKMIDAGKLKVYFRRGRMIVALPSSVLFASGKAELSERGHQALAKVAATLKDLSKRRFVVAGHTDNRKIKKSGFLDNWELSTVRALVVTRFLITQGMKARGLAAAGYGPHDPVRSNKKRSGRRLNRRIELILEPHIPPIPKELRDKIEK